MGSGELFQKGVRKSGRGSGLEEKEWGGFDQNTMYAWVKLSNHQFVLI